MSVFAIQIPSSWRTVFVVNQKYHTLIYIIIAGCKIATQAITQNRMRYGKEAVHITIRIPTVCVLPGQLLCFLSILYLIKTYTMSETFPQKCFKPEWPGKNNNNKKNIITRLTSTITRCTSKESLLWEVE